MAGEMKKNCAKNGSACLILVSITVKVGLRMMEEEGESVLAVGSAGEEEGRTRKVMVALEWPNLVNDGWTLVECGDAVGEWEEGGKKRRGRYGGSAY